MKNHCDFLPVCTPDEKHECEACSGDPEEPWWYQTDFIGHSINLPLDEDMVRNLVAADDIDPARVSEILEASRNRERGLFKDLESFLPTRKLTQVFLCTECMEREFIAAWVEEICQLKDIVTTLEQRILFDKKSYDSRWLTMETFPENLPCSRFCDIPWPVRGAQSLTSPDQLSKTEVRRFLFSRCIFQDNLNNRRPGLLPHEVYASYKRKWDPKFFKDRLPWYCQNTPSFVTESAAILEGVTKVKQYLDEFENENWEVVLRNDASFAEWKWSTLYRLKPQVFIQDTGTYSPERWPRVDDKPTSPNKTLISLGLCLVTEAVILASFTH